MSLSPIERFALWILRRHIPASIENGKLLDTYTDLQTIERVSARARERLRIAVLDAQIDNMRRAPEDDTWT